MGYLLWRRYRSRPTPLTTSQIQCTRRAVPMKVSLIANKKGDMTMDREEGARVAAHGRSSEFCCGRSVGGGC